MLTAKGEEEDKFLLARAKAVIKARPIFAEEQITFCDISLNIATHKVFREIKKSIIMSLFFLTPFVTSTAGHALSYGVFNRIGRVFTIMFGKIYL